MRVVGGIAGGLPLISPGTDLRPTMEVVKNAIFNSLMEVTPGAAILDLFAGSGSLGIEALSRGAKSCIFVEENQAPIIVAKRQCLNCTIHLHLVGELRLGPGGAHLVERAETGHRTKARAILIEGSIARVQR